MKWFAIAFTLVTITQPAIAEFKVAFVDMQEAIQATSAGKSAKSRLEKEFTKKHDDLMNREKSLQKEAKKFEKTRMVLSPEKRQ